VATAGNTEVKETNAVWALNIPDEDGAMYRERTHQARLGVARFALRLHNCNVEKRARFLVEKCQASWGGLIILTEEDELLTSTGPDKGTFFLSEDDTEKILDRDYVRTDEIHAEPLILNQFVVGYFLLRKGSLPLPDADLVKLNTELIATDLEKEREQREWERYTYLVQSERMKSISDEEQQSMVLGMAAHDLTSPVNAINGYLEMLRDNVEKSEDLEQLKSTYRKISLGVKDIASIVSQFNDYSKLKLGSGSGGGDVLVNLNWVLADLCDLLSINAEKQDLKLETELPETPLFVRADMVKLKRAVMNLVSNAIKFCRKGGEIRVALEQEGDNVAIRIHDNGVGIRKEMQDKIFRPFTQLPETLDVNDPGSLGLGLYITKRFISQLGGHIDVESEENVGSCFSILIPASDYEMNDGSGAESE
jgi:signal transduction histidine kinase